MLTKYFYGRNVILLLFYGSCGTVVVSLRFPNNREKSTRNTFQMFAWFITSSNRSSLRVFPVDFQKISPLLLFLSGFILFLPGNFPLGSSSINNHIYTFLPNCKVARGTTRSVDKRNIIFFFLKRNRCLLWQKKSRFYVLFSWKFWKKINSYISGFALFFNSFREC